MKTSSMRVRILLVGIFLWAHAQAQAPVPELPTIVPPSPEAAAFAKYGEVPVSTYSGIPKVEVPLYQISHGDIQLPIGLSYHASGIKVDEEASWVGLGWVLNAGGVISRTVMGADDLVGGGYYFSSLPDLSKTYTSRSQYYAGFTSDLVDADCDFDFFASQGIPLTIDDQFLSFQNYDFQPDQYTYNVGSYSGTFIIKRDKSGNPEAVVTNRHDKLLIRPFFSTSQYVLDKFEVTTPNGIVYTFEEIEEYLQPNTGLVIPSAWYVTKVTGASGKQLRFAYLRRNTNIKNVGARKSNGIAPICLQIAGSDGCSSSFWSETTVEGIREYRVPVLSEIDFEYGVVKFSSTDNERVDLPNGNRLNQLEVFMRGADGTQASEPQKRYVFQYDYFVATTADADGGENYFSQDHLTKRLKLVKVIEASLDQSIPLADCPTHTFSYVASPSLPAKTSLARDHWGYYNGQLGNTTLYAKFKGFPSDNFITSSVFEFPGADREADSRYTAANSLQTITYPTGGSIELVMESNTYDYTLSAANDDYRNYVPDLREESISRTVPRTQTQTIPFVIKANAFPVLVNGKALVDLKCFFRCQSTCPTVFSSGSVYASIFDLNGNPVAGSTLGLNNTNCVSNGTNCIGQEGELTVELVPGAYYIEVGVNSNSFADATVSLKFDYIPEIVEGCGLRVAEVITRDGVDPANDMHTKYDYHYWADEDGDGLVEEHTYGKRLSRPVYGYFKDVFSAKQVNGGLTGNNVCVHSHAMQFYIAANSLVGLNGTGGQIGYSKISEHIGKDGNLYGIGGKHTFVYHNAPDFVKSYTFRRPPGLPNFPAELGGLNGTLTEETQFKFESGNFVPIRKVTYTYETLDEVETYFGLYRDLLKLNGSCPGMTDLSPCRRAISFIYPAVIKEWPMLTQKEEKMYGPDGTTFVSKIHTQVYDQQIYKLRSSAMVNADGVTQKTSYTYAVEGGADVPVQMYDASQPDYKHMPGPVVEEAVYRNNTLVGKVEYKFEYQALKDRVLLGKQRAYPTGGNDFVEVAMNYDDAANIVETQRIGDKAIGYIWNRTASKPVAEVRNATADQIAYTSFEEPGLGQATAAPVVVDGGWEIVRTTNGSGGWVTNPGEFQTGKRGFHIQPSQRTIRKTGLPAGQYVLSFWYKGGMVEINPSSGAMVRTHQANDPDPAEMTYFKTTVSVGNNGSIHIAPNAQDNNAWSTFIDEVRLYPVGAQMTTYCYDEALRLITTSDANSRSQSYQYDAFGRLAYILDQDGNYIQGYDYNYQP